MRRMLIACIRAYQRCLSPLLGRHCRFEPSCSQYAIEALTAHGLIRGGALACWRLLRCQPLCRGGFDPVPAPNARTHVKPVQPPQRGGRDTHC